jgi:hypothetical protein
MGLSLLLMATQSRADILSDWGMGSDLGAGLYGGATTGFGNWTSGVGSESGVTTLASGVKEYWTEGNNTDPVDVYSNGGVPAGGEEFDEEFLAWRVVDNGGTTQLQVLGISSKDPAGFYYDGNYYRQGDVFIDTNDDGTYDYALSTGSFTDSFSGASHPGGVSVGNNGDAGLYAVTNTDTQNTTSVYGYGNYPSVTVYTNPWAVIGNLTATQSASLSIEQIANDNGYPNWAWQWTIDLTSGNALYDALIDENGNWDFSNLVLHWTVECGNDWIDTTASGENEPNVPEPATLSLMGLGLATAGLLRRRMRKAR